MGWCVYTKVKCVFDELLTFSIFWKLFVYASISEENIKKSRTPTEISSQLGTFFGAPFFIPTCLDTFKKDAAFSRLCNFLFLSLQIPPLQLCQSVSGGDHLKSREHIAKVALEARCLCLWQ